jgi:dTDP-4-amino-4,6-dideoxy-D-galactose acyltransferase
MNRLFVLNDQLENIYLASAVNSLSGHKPPKSTFKINLSQLCVDILIEKSIDLVIANELPMVWLKTMNRMGIVTVIMGERLKYYELADVVLDSHSNVLYDQSSIDEKHSYYLEIFDIVKYLDWDTKFFGIPMAYVSCLNLTENIQKLVDKFAKDNDLKMIQYLCDCHDRRSVEIAERNGYNFVDIRLTFNLDLRSFENGYHMNCDNYHYGLASSSEMNELKSLSEGIYRDSRYYFDGNFDVDRLNDFYSGWIEKSIFGDFDDECYCVFDNTKPIGFCTIRYKNQVASIGLFGISKSYGGQGIGKKLLSNVLMRVKNKGFSRVSVVTQGRNYRAQRLYQSIGFRTRSTQLWYHKWL